MKIEICESLMQSYLRHVKKCLITQTNWRVSDSWGMSLAAYKNAENIFNKIHGIRTFPAYSERVLLGAAPNASLDSLREAVCMISY